MKKKLLISYLIVSCTLILSNSFLSSCADDLNPSVSNIDTSGEATTRSAYDNSFDWENSTKVDMVNGSGNVVKNVNLPWQLGVSNMGIPSGWIDENIEEEYSQRMYTKQKNWELVYSNINETTSYKYIVLYNKMTGILRCFYYILSDPSGTGTTNSIWGIGVNKPSALFNYTSSIAEDASVRKDSPIHISTPVGAIANNNFSTVGFQNQVWYGLEIECAYDPQTTISNDCNLYLMGRAVDKITYTGTGESKGNIEGTITSTAPAGAGLSVQFSNMFNTNNSISTNQNSVVGAVGDQIANGVAAKSSFYTSLWGNIKSNAAKWAVSGLEAGVKQGLSAIVSSGGSVVASALGSLFSSMSGSTNTISKVDLKMVLNSKYKFEGEKILPGWTDCTLPIPGTKSETQANKPLYNSALGVWNLISTPQINLSILHLQMTKNGAMIIDDDGKTDAYYKSVSDQSIIILNPIISNDFSITDFSCKVARVLGECNELQATAEPALIETLPYYVGYNITQTTLLNYNYSRFYAGKKKGIVEIKFNLVSKKDNSIIYLYKKYFKADINLASEKTMYQEKRK
ncbi:hypothetical protein [Bacteroides ihuae]|uniref:hypothetical protein n=1 Tax=Bacteroides ihuae TaxID=1852362 RepID=UPI0008DA3C7A|nr:hypothetical protein [Bacteroides ihuae]